MNKTKVYVVSYLQKTEYDFSVYTKYLGCFADPEDAIDTAKAELKKLVEKYKDKDMLEVSQNYNLDDGHAYAYLGFGEDEEMETHTISIDELPVLEEI